MQGTKTKKRMEKKDSSQYSFWKLEMYSEN